MRLSEMGLVIMALFLMAIIAPCLSSTHGGHNAVVQKISGIEQFVPPKEGCVGWVTLDASKSCTWCREMSRQVLGALHKTYHSTESFISPTALVQSHYPPQSYRRDMKGTCFINYLITDNYKGLSNIFNPVALKKIRTKNWIIFIEGEKTSHFLKCWADTIDKNFGFVFPKVVLIMMHTMKTENDGYALSDPLGTGLEPVNYNHGQAAFRAAVACYMCPEGRPYFVGIQHGDKNPYNLLKKAGETKGNLGPPGISLEAEYFNAWRPTPLEGLDDDFYEEVVMFAVKSHLNFSSTTSDAKSGLISETVWSEQDGTVDSPELKSAPVKRAFLLKTAYSLVYCRAQFTNKYVTALVSPFANGSWVFFLVTVISICIVAGVRFWGGLDLFWLMQGQPPQAKKVGALIILSSIIMYPVQILYKEYYASNAMTPYKLEFLDTNKKVFESGFRFICGDMPHCLKHAEWILTGNNMKFDLEAPGKYFISPEEFETATTPNDPKRLAYGRDQGTLDYDRKYQDLVLLEQESYLRSTKCHMAEEFWWVRTATLQYTGPLSQAMYDTLQLLRQAGIINFWYKVPIKVKRRKMKRILSEQIPIDDLAEDYESGIVYMNGTLMSIMVVYLGVLALAMIILIAELMSAKVIARWKRWQERRRYLRAIWPLGKI